jgi:hypothetical protein
MGPKGITDPETGLTPEQRREVELLESMSAKIVEGRESVYAAQGERLREVARAIDYYELTPERVALAIGVSTQRVYQMLSEVSGS